MDAKVIFFTFIGVFVPLFGAGYLVGVSDRDAKALADIYSNIESLPKGSGVIFRYRCDFRSDDEVAVREVTYDPAKANDPMSGEPKLTIAMQQYLIGRPQELRLPVSKEAISALIGGASGGVTLASFAKVASELNSLSKLSISRFQWRQLTFFGKTGHLARRFGNVGMMVLGAVSGYSAGYALASRQPGCESPVALATIGTKKFWDEYSKHHAILALASVLKEVQKCSSLRFFELFDRAQTSNFQPTANDLAYLDALAGEVECATRPGKWHVPDKMCRGSVLDESAHGESTTNIYVCHALSESMPPDIAAWHAISAECWQVAVGGGAEDCEGMAPLCGEENPRFRYLASRYAQDPVAMAQIAASKPDLLRCPATSPATNR